MINAYILEWQLQYAWSNVGNDKVRVLKINEMKNIYSLNFFEQAMMKRSGH